MFRCLRFFFGDAERFVYGFGVLEAVQYCSARWGGEEETPLSLTDIDIAAWSDHVMSCILLVSTCCKSHLSVKNMSIHEYE